MQIELRGDKLLWVAAVSLGVVGLLVVYSATVGLVLRHHPTMPEYYLVKQALTLLLALFLAYAIHFSDYRRWGPLFEWLWWGSIGFLAYAFFRGSGSQRWLYIGGLSFQPSEFARFALMGLLAYRMARDPEALRSWRGLFPLLWRIGLTFTLIAPLNLSNGLMVLTLTGIFLYVGGASLGKLIRLSLLGGIGILFLFLTAPRATIWRQRLINYFRQEPSASRAADDYQRAHASLAVYSGGLWGKGPGRSTQRYYLPQSYSDFAFSILIEEYGLLGGIVILGLYGLYLWRLAALATSAQGFAQLFLIGGFLQLLFQVGIHVGVSLELLPITGIPLPWISLGGSALLVQAIGLGISAAISRALLES
ncbi:MAG: FtsW/RodA/SpoVE family cell cycle protein [Bacteroidia bacterium]|nr:FtsW/RodA/SpoVE family cell cycle protein [Bacteroidia bacterium]MDW8014944.1 FtsW/RodA/SpoVE family cell cycle protein [Bacteroidia bacterium]